MTQDADISDFTYIDQNLPPEMETYIRNKIVHLPRGYFDRWFDELGHYEPIHDEALAWSGLLPGLTIKEWQRDFPGQDFTIIRRIDRGFPARYEEFLLEHRFDVDLLNRLGADEYELDRLTQELTDCQWCPIADFLPLENDKFGYTDRQIDGHNLPAHQCLFGYYDKATWKVQNGVTSHSRSPLARTCEPTKSSYGANVPPMCCRTSGAKRFGSSS